MRYSNDLRHRVAKKLQVSNLSELKLKKISKDFDLNIGTLKNWQKKIVDGTLYQVVKKGGKPRVYDYEKLRDFVQKNPDKYLREIQAEFFEVNGLKASTSGIDDALKRMDLKLKKKSSYLRKGMRKKEKFTSKKD
jgi:transposase